MNGIVRSTHESVLLVDVFIYKYMRDIYYVQKVKKLKQCNVVQVWRDWNESKYGCDAAHAKDKTSST